MDAGSLWTIFGDCTLQAGKFGQLNMATYGLTPATWYVAEVFFAPGGDVIGSLFDSTWTTLLAQPTAEGLTRTVNGNVVIRSFDHNNFVNIRVVHGAVAPIPLQAAGWRLPGRMALVGGMVRLQRHDTA